MPMKENCIVNSFFLKVTLIFVVISASWSRSSTISIDLCCPARDAQAILGV
jgi:hypothetical protein